MKLKNHLTKYSVFNSVSAKVTKNDTPQKVKYVKEGSFVKLDCGFNNSLAKYKWYKYRGYFYKGIRKDNVSRFLKLNLMEFSQMNLPFFFELTVFFINQLKKMMQQ